MNGYKRFNYSKNRGRNDAYITKRIRSNQELKLYYFSSTWTIYINSERLIGEVEPSKKGRNHQKDRNEIINTIVGYLKPILLYGRNFSLDLKKKRVNRREDRL